MKGFYYLTEGNKAHKMNSHSTFNFQLLTFNFYTFKLSTPTASRSVP